MKSARIFPGVLAGALVVILAGLRAAGGPQQSVVPVPNSPPAHGAISGIVVDGATGAPVQDAIVSLAGGVQSATQPNRQLTDAKGRFAFTELADSDSFQITSSKFGLLDGGYGRDSGPADALRPIVIKGGVWVPNLRVPIWRAGGLSGTVRDENGEPVVGVFVRALARLRIGGRDEFASGPVTLTDDRGIYRLPGLFPGRYVVQVPSPQMSVPASVDLPAPRIQGAIDGDDGVRLVIDSFPMPPARVDGRTMVYAQTFHPSGSAIAQAAVVEVSAGDERSGIDVTIAPVPAVRVSGIIEGPPEALASLTIRLLSPGLEGGGFGSEIATTLVAADGRFTFVNVPSGSYTLDAPSHFSEFTIRSGPSRDGGFVGSSGYSLPPPPPRGGWSSTGVNLESNPGVSLSQTDYRGNDAPNYFGRASVTVGATDVTNVVVRLHPPTTLRGHIILEFDPAKPAPAQAPRIQIRLDSAGGLAALGLPGTWDLPDFEIPGVQPGDYWLQTLPSSAWLVKSVQWRGRDFTTSPIPIAGGDDASGVMVTLTNKSPTLSGTVRMPSAATVDGSAVVAFPASADLRANAGLFPSRVKLTMVSSSGSYRFTTLPAGDYFVAAIDRDHVSGWRDPEFLLALERVATRVSLDWGRTSNADLTPTVVK